ncbi:hypothetical protein [Burkholderia ubonensis]|uniref:hypothetical protein n=1 Tax=Burkholderia ubonensis TaxID=101571 RepID=UPI00075466E8|nr:hypothetical protein [Burkholderia ubonensis]KVV07426.1 hypothetical protein WK77_16700 [Burkholderia ubonensis]
MAYFEKDETVAARVAFVGLARSIQLEIMVETRSDLDREFNYALDDVAVMALSPAFPEAKMLVDEVLATFASRRAQLEAAHSALIAKLSAQSK